MTARDWMRRGFEPDLAEWAAAAEEAWFMRLIGTHAGWSKHRGFRRVFGRIGLSLGCRALSSHRFLWRHGMRFR